jgi:lipid-A-disaccharide synthase-like uncharacterized protein
LLIVVHVGAVIGCLTVPLAFWFKAVLGVALALSLYINLRRYALLNVKDSVVAMTLQEDGIALLRFFGEHTGNNDDIKAQIHYHSTILAGLIVLLFRLPDCRRLKAVVILDNGLNAYELRALRLWMRWKAQPTLTNKSCLSDDAPRNAWWFS